MADADAVVPADGGLQEPFDVDTWAPGGASQESSKGGISKADVARVETVASSVLPERSVAQSALWHTNFHNGVVLLFE